MYEMTRNPFSMTTKEKVSIGVAVAAAVGLAAYFMSRPAAAASSPSTTSTTTYVLNAATPTLSIVDSNGITLQLPAGAKWAGGGTASGTSNAIVIPTMPPGTPTQTLPIQWTDASGTLQTTTITFSV